MCDESGPFLVGGGGECHDRQDVLSLAFAQIADGMAILDLDGQVLLANRAFAMMHGYEADELVGRHISAFQASEQTAAAQPVRRQIFNAGTFDDEVRHLRRDGTTFPALMQMTLVRDASDRPLASIATIRDITVDTNALEALRASLHEKDVLLREVHHRVKNNLQVISSILSIQATAATDGAAKDVLHNCRARVRAIAMVHERLSQYRDLSQIDLGQYVRTLAREIFASAGMQDGRVTLTVKVDEVDMDIDRAVPCGLILNELLANALAHAYGPEQGGEVRVGLTGDDEGLVLTVADDGCGLSQDIVGSSAGSLGLKLVYALARQLAGQVEVDRNGGTAFHVRFPHSVSTDK